MNEKIYGITGTVAVHAVILLVLAGTFFHPFVPSRQSPIGIPIRYGDSEEEIDGETKPLQAGSPTAVAAAQPSAPAQPVANGNAPKKENSAAQVQPATQKAKLPVAGKTVYTQKESSATVSQPASPVLGESKEVSDAAIRNKLKSSDTPSSGTSAGTGSGSAVSGSGGTGSGKQGSPVGIRLSVPKGRTTSNKVMPVYKVNCSATVKVRITIDKSGKVVSAEPSVIGTPQGDGITELQRAAKAAAMATVFNTIDAETNQIGYITYVFSTAAPVN
jgi:hypothetical protein